MSDHRSETSEKSFSEIPKLKTLNEQKTLGNIPGKEGRKEGGKEGGREGWII